MGKTKTQCYVTFRLTFYHIEKRVLPPGFSSSTYSHFSNPLQPFHLCFYIECTYLYHEMYLNEIYNDVCVHEPNKTFVRFACIV